MKVIASKKIVSFREIEVDSCRNGLTEKKEDRGL
jgi:hypothetical protein